MTSTNDVDAVTEAIVKKMAVESQIQQTGSVYVTLDARHAGVSVPSVFSDRSMLTLHIGNNMPVPIPDLAILESGISATLSFDREPHLCVIPWAAVYALSSDGKQGILFHNSKPADVPLGQRKPPGPALKVLDGDCDAEPAPETSSVSRSHLKLV